MAWMVRGLPPFLRRSWRRSRGRGWLIGLAMAGLVGALFTASPAAAAHPSMALSSATAEVDSASADPPPAEAPPPVTPATAALICLVALALPGLLAARSSRRAGIVAAAALLVWFAGETAIHSAHHLGDPAEAERCPVFSASQHLSGLDPEPGGPVLDRPAPTAVGPPAPPAAAAHVVLDGEQARAPPAFPA